MKECESIEHGLFQMRAQELLKGALHEDDLSVNDYHAIWAHYEKIVCDGKSTKTLGFDMLQAKSKYHLSRVFVN